MNLLTNKFVQAIVLKMARAAIMGLGGTMVQQGLATSDQATSLEGSLIFLAGVAFSAYDAWSVKRQVAQATASVPPGYVPAPQATMQPIPNPPAP
jgi:uncharacterized membrane protein YebE (DUF533 family)